MAMAIYRPGSSAAAERARSTGVLDGPGRGDEAVQSRNRDSEADARGASRGVSRKRPLVGRVAAKPTVGSDIGEPLRSCLAPAHRWCADRGAALEDVDDDHRRAAVPADEGGP